MLIAIEGCNGVGKTTVITALVKLFETAGRNVTIFKYPSNLSEEGIMCRKCLSGECNMLPPYEWAALCAADRANTTHLIEKALDIGVVILDRYYISGITYAILLGVDQKYAADLEAHSLEPDLTVVLACDPAVIIERRSTRQVSYDAIERDVSGIDVGIDTIATRTKIQLEQDTIVHATTLVSVGAMYIIIGTCWTVDAIATSIFDVAVKCDSIKPPRHIKIQI